MTKFVGKGSLISVLGRLTSRKDNRDQYRMEVSANSVTFLDRRKDFNVTDSEFQKNNFEKNKNNEVSIDEEFQNSENYDTEITFINNDNLNNNDLDDSENENAVI